MRFIRHALSLSTALLVSLSAASALADEVRLANGDRISGEVVHLVGGTLTFKTPYAGDIKIDWKQVTGLTTDKELPVVLADKSQLVGKVVAGEEGKLVSETKIGVSPTYDVSEVVAIAPPPPPPAFRYKGGLNFTGKVTDGNSNTKTASARAELVTRTEKQRLTLRGRWDYAEDEGGISARNAFGSIKLDFFMTKKLFAYGVASFEGDKFKDLDLRSMFGAGLGYQWIEEDDLNFYTEAGISYVVENRARTRDSEFVSARVAWSLTWSILPPDRLVFFHYAELLPGLEDANDFSAHTETGIRAKLTDNWFTLAEVDFDYDNTPARGFGRKDTAYILGIGYTFGN